MSNCCKTSCLQLRLRRDSKIELRIVISISLKENHSSMLRYRFNNLKPWSALSYSEIVACISNCHIRICGCRSSMIFGKEPNEIYEPIAPVLRATRCSEVFSKAIIRQQLLMRSFRRTWWFRLRLRWETESKLLPAPFSARRNCWLWAWKKLRGLSPPSVKNNPKSMVDNFFLIFLHGLYHNRC